MTRTFWVGLALLMLSMRGASALTVAVATDDLSDTGGSIAQVIRPPDATAIWADPSPSIEVVTAPATAKPEAPARALSANPLWAVPLVTLTATRDRPIFSASRRPPQAAVAPATVAKVAPAPKPREPERPQLSLVGTVASDNEGFGIFLDNATHAALRLKVGEEYQGWKLRAVRGREVTLEKDQQSATLALPAPGEQQADGAKLSASRVFSQSVGRSDR